MKCLWLSVLYEQGWVWFALVCDVARCFHHHHQVGEVRPRPTRMLVGNILGLDCNNEYKKTL